MHMLNCILYCMSSMRPSLLTALQGCPPPMTHAEAMASATLEAQAFAPVVPDSDSLSVG